MNICRFARLCALLLVMFAASSSYADATTDNFEWELTRLMHVLDVPGLAVAVVRDGNPIFQETYGLADIESETAMTTDTLIEIASVTKTMTSIVVGQLIDEGKISLDDPVVRYPFAEWFKPDRVGADITLRHVLSHTSQGLPLGTNYLYQGNRFNFVWGVFGSATPNTFQDSLSRRILQPLEMSDTFPQTGIAFTEANRSRVATPYRYEKSTGGPLPVQNPPSPEKNQVVPAAGLFSTLGDMTKYVTALQSRKLVEPDTWSTLQTPEQAKEGSPLPYAIGWAVQDVGGEQLVWHYGFGNGNSALLVRAPAKKLAFVLMSNSGNVSGSTRWGYGDLLNSPFATTFVRHFLIEGDRAASRIDFDGDLRALERSIEQQVRHHEDVFVLRELFAEATILALMEGANRNTKRASELLVMLDRLAPEMLRARGLTALDVLRAVADERLEGAHVAISERLLDRYPTHPIVVLRSAQLRLRQRDFEQAKRLLHRVADSTAYEDERYTVDACLELGALYLDSDPNKAREYFWRVVTLASRIPADLSRQINIATKHLTRRSTTR